MPPERPATSRNITSRVILVTGVVVGSVLILVSLFPKRLLAPAEPETAEVVTPRAKVPPPLRAASPFRITALPIAAEASASLRSTEGSAEDDLSTIELLLSQYARHHQGNPTGENEEITAALLGKNTSHVAFLENEGAFLNSARQLIDRWGTPYFFHQISAKQTEIRSAGPDRILHTDDDLVR